MGYTVSQGTPFLSASMRLGRPSDRQYCWASLYEYPFRFRSRQNWPDGSSSTFRVVVVGESGLVVWGVDGVLVLGRVVGVTEVDVLDDVDVCVLDEVKLCVLDELV